MPKDSYDVFSYPGAFSPKECRNLIQTLDKPHRLSNSPVAASFDPRKGLTIDKNVRKTVGTTIYKKESEFTWVRNRILKHCKEANENYKTRITEDLTDDLQFLKYGPGGHYIRHRDIGSGYFAYRELSVVVQLSSTKDYRGGELLMQNKSNKPDVAPKDQGTIIIFPSHLYHQVMPVTKGVRYSLVAWVARPPTTMEKIKGALTRSK